MTCAERNCQHEATRRWYDRKLYCVYHFLLRFRAAHEEVA